MSFGSWEIRERNRVFAYTIHTEQTTIAWALGLRRLQIPGPEPIGIAGMPFDHARNAAVQAFLASECQFLLSIDSDVIAPPDAVHRLLAHNKPVVSGMYCRRSPPHAVPVMMRNNQWVTEVPGPGQNPLIEVDLVGAGLLLVHRTVFEELTKLPHRPGKPWFDWRVDLQGHIPVGEALSEDYSFCLSVRRLLGIPIIVDTSVRCLHVGNGEAGYGTFFPLGATPVA